MPVNWKNYPPDWKRIAFNKKESVGWKCEKCGKQCRKPGEPFDTHKRTLTVSHKDHNPMNCAENNLQAYCAPCHLKYDAKHHAETRRKKKMAKLRYFKFYYFYKQAFQELNPFAAKKLLLAIIEYSEYGKIPKLRGKAKKYFNDAKSFIDADAEINRKNGYLGSRKRWKSQKSTK